MLLLSDARAVDTAADLSLSSLFFFSSLFSAWVEMLVVRKGESEREEQQEEGKGGEETKVPRCCDEKGDDDDDGID